MKKLLLLSFLILSILPAAAQNSAKGGKSGFDPKNFESQLEKYIVKEAQITKKERAKFLPIFREMRREVIKILESERKAAKKKPTTEKEWEAALKAHDNAEVQMKKVVQIYHNKMLTAIPASKVMEVMKAEDNFYKDSFMKLQKGQDPGPGKPGPPPPPRAPKK